LICTAWYLFSKLLFEHSLLIFYPLKRTILRCFGAKVGVNVVIKPGVRVKYPWHLNIGNDVWIGEDVWIDNLADVTIESNVCISQQAYLCTGSHDFYAPGFDLIVQPIRIESGSWLAARVTVLPGVTIATGSMCAAGAVVHRSIAANVIVGGVPARVIRNLSLKASGENNAERSS
jgi:putative colanic acid biosynthesis acetyltransferase WcaF